MKTVITVTTALFLLANPAAADPRNFTLTNNTGKTIDELYVSPSNEEEWEEDVLGVETLEDEDEAEIDFSQDDRDECEYDLKIVFDDDSSAVWEDVDLCEIEDVSVSYVGGKPHSDPDGDDEEDDDAA